MPYEMLPTHEEMEFDEAWLDELARSDEPALQMISRGADEFRRACGERPNTIVLPKATIAAFREHYRLWKRRRRIRAAILVTVVGGLVWAIWELWGAL